MGNQHLLQTLATDQKNPLNKQIALLTKVAKGAEEEDADAADTHSTEGEQVGSSNDGD
jgi:hypothetical protein